MWLIFLCVPSLAGWYTHRVSDTALPRIPVNNVLGIAGTSTWFAVEEVDPVAAQSVENDPHVLIFDWTAPTGSSGAFRATTSIPAGGLNNNTLVDSHLAFHLPAVCYLDGNFYIDVRTSPDAQLDVSPANGQPDSPPQLSTEQLPYLMANLAVPNSSTEAGATTTEMGGHHTLECRTEDAGWLERLWTAKPLPNSSTSNDVIGKVADEGTPVPDWSGSTGTTTFANTSLVEDHAVQAFFWAGNYKRMVVWHLTSSGGNDALQVRIDDWSTATDSWSVGVAAYSLTGVAGHHYNWPTIAIWEENSYVVQDHVRIAAEDQTDGTIVTWACSGTDLETACNTNSTLKWTTNAVVAASADPPPVGRTDQDPILTVSSTGDWFLAAQRVTGPDFADRDEVLFLSACSNGLWDTVWDKRFWASGATGLPVPLGGMARLSYRQLKGWPQMIVDEYYGRVKVGYLIDRDSDANVTDYEAWTASKSIDSICEEAG